MQRRTDLWGPDGNPSSACLLDQLWLIVPFLRQLSSLIQTDSSTQGLNTSHQTPSFSYPSTQDLGYVLVNKSVASFLPYSLEY